MKQLLKVIEVMPQRTFQSQRGENIVATGMRLSQGRDQFYGEAYGQQAIGLPENLGGGDLVWCDLSFTVNKREYEGKTFYEQRVNVSNVERI